MFIDGSLYHLPVVWLGYVPRACPHALPCLLLPGCVLLVTRSTNQRWTQARQARDPMGYQEWLSKGAERKKDCDLRKRYGISLDEYNEMLVLQDGMCAMCGNAPQPHHHRPTLHVDHDHRSGTVRALLCATCNWVVGFFENGHSELALIYLARYGLTSERLESMPVAAQRPRGESRQDEAENNRRMLGDAARERCRALRVA